MPQSKHPLKPQNSLGRSLVGKWWKSFMEKKALYSYHRSIILNLVTGGKEVKNVNIFFILLDYKRP